MLCGCATYRRYESTRPTAIQETESRLGQAGFQVLMADQPDQVMMVRGLPTFQLHSYPSLRGKIYWYNDPVHCRCVYVGDDHAYQNYQWALMQQNDTAAYVADSQDYNDVLALEQFNQMMFPVPVYVAGGIVGGTLNGGGHDGAGGGHIAHSGGPAFGGWYGHGGHGGGGHR